MAEENKIKVNDLPEDKKEQTEETEQIGRAHV